MDLTRDAPRSPYESLGGIVFVPRAIDKGRADLAGTLGEYVSRTGWSKDLFEFLSVSPDDFIEALRTRATDNEVWEWVQANMQPRAQEEIATWNERMMTCVPETAKSTASYRRIAEDIGQAHRTDLTRKLDFVDLEEGRDVPIGGRC